jgi:hypothetical protein
MTEQKGKTAEPVITEFLDYLDFAIRLKRSYEIIEKINK